MKIGLMGGTFNPVHLAHLRIAEEARESCGLDRVVFIPAADPPHKLLAAGVTFAKRYEMVAMAIAANPCFDISDMEGQRGGKSYSIDTIAAFREACPDDELSFIIGSDSFHEFGLWHRYDEIIRSCSLIVLQRPGQPVADPIGALPIAIRKEFSYTALQNSLLHKSGNMVRFLDGIPLDISSSDIRKKIESGHSIKYLVPPEVEAYIKEQRIYT